jgi:hypothetical protein
MEWDIKASKRDHSETTLKNNIPGTLLSPLVFPASSPMAHVKVDVNCGGAGGAEQVGRKPCESSAVDRRVDKGWIVRIRTQTPETGAGT